MFSFDSKIELTSSFPKRFKVILMDMFQEVSSVAVNELVFTGDFISANSFLTAVNQTLMRLNKEGLKTEVGMYFLVWNYNDDTFARFTIVGEGKHNGLYQPYKIVFDPFGERLRCARIDSISSILHPDDSDEDVQEFFSTEVDDEDVSTLLTSAKTELIDIGMMHVPVERLPEGMP